jgi:hypothetical protein
MIERWQRESPSSRRTRVSLAIEVVDELVHRLLYVIRLVLHVAELAYDPPDSKHTVLRLEHHCIGESSKATMSSESSTNASSPGTSKR